MTVTEELKKVIAERKQQVGDEAFQKGLKMYKELVKQGKITPRGNRLATQSQLVENDIRYYCNIN